MHPVSLQCSPVPSFYSVRSAATLMQRHDAAAKPRKLVPHSPGATRSQKWSASFLGFRTGPWSEATPFQSTKQLQCKLIVRAERKTMSKRFKKCTPYLGISASMRAIQAIQGSILDRRADIIAPSPTLGILWHPASLQLGSEPGWHSSHGPISFNRNVVRNRIDLR